MELKQGADRFIAIPKETKDLILMYRLEHKLSYRGIEKRLGVSRETARLYCVEHIPEEKQLALARKKKKKGVKVKNRSITKKSKPAPQHNSVRDYDFLQYIRVVFKWALKNHPELNRTKLEMLLYLYPRGAFTYSKFHVYYKTIGMYQSKALTGFIEQGYITIWQKKSNGKARLFTLTNKAKSLCDEMHKYCTGDLKMSLGEDNAIIADKGTRINTYYANMIKDMNKRKKVAN
jgi:hypothetical protein